MSSILINSSERDVDFNVVEVGRAWRRGAKVVSSILINSSGRDVDFKRGRNW
ncbi:MAG: hypothetical protein JST48_11920 [Bacteroidetes bacterium]|nr:hypothetical protein [Bacteroidota bacterium]